jgi:hypothetical protein
MLDRITQARPASLWSLASMKFECSYGFGPGSLYAEPRAFRSAKSNDIRMELFCDGPAQKLPRSLLKRIALAGNTLEQSVNETDQPRRDVRVGP